MTFFIALLVTLGIAIPMVSLAVFGAEKRAEAFGGGASATVVLFFINWAVFYFALPIVGFSSTTYWHSGAFIPLFFEAVLLLGFASWCGDDPDNGTTFNFGSGIAAGILIVFAVPQIFAGVWTTERAHVLSDQLKVTAADQHDPTQALKDYPPTDPNHIVLLSSDMASAAASRAMSQLTSITVKGFTGNANSVYELGGGELQSVRNHAYYLYPLKPTGWRASNKVAGSSPGYMQVDAEDPNATPTLVTKDYAGHPLDIQYSPGGFFSHDLGRHVWYKYHDRVTDDPTLEVDDNGRPWYTITLNKLTLNRKFTVPDKLLLVDAQTGNIVVKSLNDIPDWVDRVYSPGTVENMINNWGRWHFATRQLIESDVNRYTLPDGEHPVVVYTQGGHPQYQAILVARAKNAQKAPAYLLMVDARTGQATSFQIPQLSLESVASSSISKSVASQRLFPTHLVLHMVYGQLTWVSPLEGQSDDNHGFQGVSLVRATNTNGSGVVWSKTKADALEAYRQQVARGNGSNAGPNSGSNTRSTESTVTRVNALVENGQTVFYFTLKDDPKHLFKGEPSDDIPDLRFIAVGAKVRVTYLDVGDTLVDVGGYSDLTLPDLKPASPTPSPSTTSSPAASATSSPTT